MTIPSPQVLESALALISTEKPQVVERQIARCVIEIDAAHSAMTSFDDYLSDLDPTLTCDPFVVGFYLGLRAADVTRSMQPNGGAE